MDDSERLQRLRQNHYDEERDIFDKEFADRIADLLNHTDIDKYCMVDAYYYDFSVIPEDVQEKFHFWHDVYLIYGITTKGEIVSKWVDRWELDSSVPIVDGNVMHEKNLQINFVLEEKHVLG